MSAFASAAKACAPKLHAIKVAAAKIPAKVLKLRISRSLPVEVARVNRSKTALRRALIMTRIAFRYHLHPRRNQIRAERALELVRQLLHRPRPILAHDAIGDHVRVARDP